MTELEMPDEIQGGVVAPTENAAPAVDGAAPEVTPESAQIPAESKAADTELAEGENEPPVEKTLTQKEVDDIVQKRTAKLARQRDQERQKREVLEQELAKAAIPTDAGRPRLDQFEDPDAYAEAVADWKLGLRDRQEKVIEQHKSHSTFESKASELMADLEEVEGFDQAKWQKLPISDAMAQAIVDSDVGVKVAQHLYSHPDIASQIANLSPARQAAEIGKLEAKLSTAPKLSKAPDPITPIGKGNASTSRNLSDLSMEDYIAERKKQGARWAR